MSKESAGSRLEATLGRARPTGGSAAKTSRLANRPLWPLAAAAVAAGVVCWVLDAGIAALWLFMVAAVVLAVTLPFPVALVSPLFMGVIGWVVDMLPLVILAGWAAVAARWVVTLVRERRRPRGGKWIWLPVGLAAWTSLGVFSIESADLKRFALLFAIQVLSSVTLLAAVDCLSDLERRTQTAFALVCFVLLLSAGVFLEWIGVPIQELQDRTVSDRVEAAYGVDAFTNSLPMIKYVRSSKAGAPGVRAKVERLRRANPGLPPAEVFKPKFQAWRTSLLVRFEGSARPYERQLARMDVELLYDNVGLVPANTVPRMRSFPRNSLTFAGSCAALVPLAFFFAWTGAGRRRLVGWLAVAGCLFGAAFSLSRGAWVAVVVGAVYLMVDGAISGGRKLQIVGACVAAALVITGVFVVKYGVDPLSARGEVEGSTNTREKVYADSVANITNSGKPLFIGYGTETARGAGGTSHVLGRYIPDAGTHSTYLNYLYRAGLPAALALIAVYAIAILHARAASRTVDPTERAFSTLVTAALVTVAAQGLVLSLFVEPIYTLGVSLLVGLAMAAGTSLGRSVQPWRHRSA